MEMTCVDRDYFNAFNKFTHNGNAHLPSNFISGYHCEFFWKVQLDAIWQPLEIFLPRVLVYALCLEAHVTSLLASQ